jgi:hypothetical protein
VCPNKPVQDFPALRESIEGRDLIGSHEAAIAFDVSRKNSSQPALRFNGLGQGKPQCLRFPWGILILRSKLGQLRQAAVAHCSNAALVFLGIARQLCRFIETTKEWGQQARQSSSPRSFACL